MVNLFFHPDVSSEIKASYDWYKEQADGVMPAGGNNPGIKYALSAQTYDYVWILNNDTIVHSDALGKLCECADRKEAVGIWGSTMAYDGQRNKVQCGGGCSYNPLRNAAC